MDFLYIIEGQKTKLEAVVLHNGLRFGSSKHRLTFAAAPVALHWNEL